MRKINLYSILLLFMICLLCSCNKNTKEDKKSTAEIETGGGIPIDPNRHTDYSEVRDDLSRLAEDEITEIYLYWGNKEYSTKDKEIIHQIKEQLMTVELEEPETRFEEKSMSEWLVGGYNLQLCSQNKIYYAFEISGNEIQCGHKQYIAISGKGLDEAIKIAKSTFWKD